MVNDYSDFYSRDIKKELEDINQEIDNELAQESVDKTKITKLYNKLLNKGLWLQQINKTY